MKTLVLLLVSLTTASAFVPFSRRFDHAKPISLIGTMSFQASAGDDAFDVEAVRQRLESLVGTDGSEPGPQVRERPASFLGVPSALAEVQLPPPPPLTAIDRERRQAEIQLLRELNEDDEALSSLWDLWFQERGPVATAKLIQAEEWSNQGPAVWKQAESLLRSLIQEYGVYWAEPVNRLATLYYLQGRLEDSERLCQMVLKVKPWHFGALSGIVMVYAQQHDVEKARFWAAKRLPTLSAPKAAPNRRRLAWVEQALKDAKQSMKSAERQVHDAFGKPDPHAARDHADDDPDAWQ